MRREGVRDVPDHLTNGDHGCLLLQAVWGGRQRGKGKRSTRRMRVVCIWWLCGMVAALLAARHGRRSMGWLLLSLLGGPWALVVALLPSREVHVHARTRAQGIAGACRTCPWCAKTIRVEAVTCRSCHRAVPPLQPALLPVEVFLADAPRVHAWLTQHADGFVLQCDRQRRAMILHRATCPRSRQPRALSTPTGECLGLPVIQVCSRSAPALQAWATQQGHPGTPQTCTHCG
jgi:hypothetical protein